MGREPARAGKYVYFCLALLMFFAGCTLLPESDRRKDIRESLVTGNSALARGEYGASLKAFEHVLLMVQDQPPADVATYNIGLVYAHPLNPQKDRQKAIASFARVVAKFPQSAWAEPAKIWVGVLNESEQWQQDTVKSRQLLEQSHQENEQSRLTLERTKQEMEKTRLDLDRSRQEIEKSKQMIEKSKQVDMEIEQKRRDRRK
jgi:tetratricopeptide (TPR) repeat protein